MKKISILTLLILFSITAFGQWQWQMPKPTGAALMDVGSFSPDVVFMVGLNGTIIKTSDGGNSFTQIESGTHQFLKTIYCVNEDVGWISSDSGLVMRTENGGETWSKVREPKSWEKSSFFALDENTAWLSTDYGKLLKTTSAGQNWAEIETGIDKSFSNIQFLDATTGFAVINESTPEQTSFADTVVLKTQDGGQTWDTLDLTFHNNVSFIETFRDDYVWIGTTDYMMKSDDLGQTWDTVWLPGEKFNLNPLSIAFRSENSFWLLTVKYTGDLVNYNIFYTADGGLTWENQYNSYYDIWGGSGQCKNDLNKLDYGNDVCWAVGSPGRVLSSRENDSIWQKHYKTAGGTIHDLFFLDSQNGYAVGYAFTFLKTQDGGKTWETGNDLPGGYGYRVYFISENTGFVAITDEGLYKTTDGGTTWKQVLEKDNFLVSLVFEGSENGWVLHSHGEVYRTTDSGETWQLLSALPEGTWWDLFFANAQTGFASGKYGIMKTTDGGITWTNVLNSDVFINDLWFNDSQTGWAAGDEGLVYKTTDGGNSWALVDTLPSGSLYNVRFLNAQTGYIINDSYGIFRSDDGGETWTFEPVFGLPMYYNPLGYLRTLTTYRNNIWISYNCQILHKTDETTGIVPGQKISENEIMIYPNPASKQLFIESKNTLTEITILNINGQILLNRKLPEGKSFSQNIDFLTPGIYFLKTRSDKGIILSKFVKMSR